MTTLRTAASAGLTALAFGGTSVFAAAPADYVGSWTLDPAAYVEHKAAQERERHEELARKLITVVETEEERELFDAFEARFEERIEDERSKWRDHVLRVTLNADGTCTIVRRDHSSLADGIVTYRGEGEWLTMGEGFAVYVPYDPRWRRGDAEEGDASKQKTGEAGRGSADRSEQNEYEMGSLVFLARGDAEKVRVRAGVGTSTPPAGLSLERAGQAKGAGEQPDVAAATRPSRGSPFAGRWEVRLPQSEPGSGGEGSGKSPGEVFQEAFEKSRETAREMKREAERERASRESSGGAAGEGESEDGQGGLASQPGMRLLQKFMKVKMNEAKENGADSGLEAFGEAMSGMDGARRAGADSVALHLGRDGRFAARPLDEGQSSEDQADEEAEDQRAASDERGDRQRSERVSRGRWWVVGDRVLLVPGNRSPRHGPSPARTEMCVLERDEDGGLRVVAGAMPLLWIGHAQAEITPAEEG